MNNKIITRFAPSPTGFMHVGGIRTALFAYLFAKKNNGTFILRIEDTDKEREVLGSVEHIIESLKWLGIDWDQGPDIGGPNAPYKQSERLESYKKYAHILIDKGLAYADPYTEEEVEVFRNKAIEEKRPFLYRDYRPENPPIWDGSKPLRLKIKNVKSYEWEDLARGHLKAGPEALDDFILIKADGYPTYNFAHIIDDLEMGVTHIMRGDEFISSTPKFLALYDALEIKRPEFVILPPIMGAEGKKKLGKRDGAKDVLEYRNEGYLPEAMLNFLAFIGWNPGNDEKEIFTKDELINAFDIKGIHISGGKFNEEKLDWINKEHIKLLPASVLEEKVFAWLPKDLQIKKIVPLIVERISKFGDIKAMLEIGELDFFYKEPMYTKEKLIYKNTETAKTIDLLSLVIDSFEKIEEVDFNIEKIKIILMGIADNAENRGSVLHPIRYALSGLDKSPDPFILSDILGKDKTISRLKEAINILKI
jgi:glutamyl-tRNA synthetase